MYQPRGLPSGLRTTRLHNGPYGLCELTKFTTQSSEARLYSGSIQFLGGILPNNSSKVAVSNSANSVSGRFRQRGLSEPLAANISIIDHRGFPTLLTSFKVVLFFRRAAPWKA